VSDAPQRYRRLGKYELHQLLGEGAMGIVWKAYDTVLRRYVALKLLSASFRKTKDMQERFLREARAAGAIQHANIVTVYDLGESEGQLYIAMELVEGRDLSDMIALRDPLALERKLDIAIEVLTGLHFAHQRGVIHRDVKPSNVRVMPDGRVKIMDFGIARLQKADATGSGAIVGTPTYMAPEQITNGAITAATDVFSVGCMLYELLCYQRPFEAESVHGVLYQVLTTEPRPLRTVAPSIPAALERVVAKAMNKVPHERYESAGQMMATLQQIRSALSGADDEATQPLGRWTPLPQPVLKLITHASMRARLVVLGALAAVVLLLVFSPSGQPAGTQESAALPQANPPGAAPAPTFAAAPPTIPEAPVSMAVSLRRDSAYAARDRAIAAGARKNSVSAWILAESMFQASEQAVQTGDQSRAIRGYVEAVTQYQRAREQARVMDREAQLMVQRVTPVVQSIPTGAAAANAGIFLARAESLLREQDFTLAKVAAQSAEQVGVDVGIAPPSLQPANPRAAIDVLLLDLGRALASERVANLQVLYPGLTDEERRGWERFFREWDQITAKFTIDDFRVQSSAGNASAHVRAMFQYVPAPGGAPRMDRRRFAMRFEKKDVGWRLAGVSEVK
jgi:eukaryotic-like serine/threonine-protein kinase